MSKITKFFAESLCLLSLIPLAVGTLLGSRECREELSFAWGVWKGGLK